MNLAPLVLALLPAQLPPATTVPPPSTPPAVTTVPDDVQMLKGAHLGVTGPALLDFFRKRCPPAPERKWIAERVKQLSDKTAPVREAAAGELVSLGPAAVPRLRQAANHLDDPISSACARQCLQQIEGIDGANLVVAAVRQLALQKPPGTAEVLLAYLPFADNPHVVQEVETALGVAALREGTIDPGLLAALKDPVPARRGAAAAVLCKLGGAGLAAVRPLLQDPRPSVRLRAALGLLGTYDAEAVPVLIDLLADLPPEQRKPAEDYLNELAGEWKVVGPPGNDAVSGRLRREAWAAWWRQTDGTHLLEEFRKRTLTDDQRAEVLALLAKLADASEEEREKATADFITWGPRIAPLLRQVANQGPPHVGAFAARCLESLGKEQPSLPTASARLLALRRPPGTLEALLAYLPYADSDAMAAQVLDLLPRLGCPEGKAEPVLIAALADKVPCRRMAAARTLCQAIGGHQPPREQLLAVRKLLQDEDREVRFQTARALANINDKDAIPVLIALLGELPLEQGWEVEDYLMLLAGDRAPTVALADDASRAAVRDAWKRWWRENGPGLDLAKVDPERRSGSFLVVENFNPTGGRGRVLELNAAGKVRWQIDNLNFPWDAEVLPGGKVLVIEQNQRLSERYRKGPVAWEKLFANVFTCQGLRNGHIFLACRTHLFELDPAGKTVFTWSSPNGTILAARRLRDGQTAFVTYQGVYVRLDAAGKPAKTFQLPFQNFGLGGADVAAGDCVVVSVQNLNKVMEYGPDGKVRWQAEVLAPGIPHRLANGQTLVPSNHNTRLVRLDATGKIVSELKDLSFRPFRVHGR
jgi:HEAT repeat protein